MRTLPQASTTGPHLARRVKHSSNEPFKVGSKFYILFVLCVKYVLITISARQVCKDMLSLTAGCLNCRNGRVETETEKQFCPRQLPKVIIFLVIPRPC